MRPSIRRVDDGIYETTDGRFRIEAGHETWSGLSCHAYDGPTWHLWENVPAEGQIDGHWGTFPTKRAAVEAIVAGGGAKSWTIVAKDGTSS